MISALLLSAVLAQAEPSPTLTPTEPPPPPADVAPAEAPPVPAPAPARAKIPEAFYREVLAWDTEAGHAVKGRQRAPMAREDFFREVGRVDLVDQSASLRTRRILLAVSAGAVLVAGTITSAVLFSNAGDLNSQFCTANVRNFNDVCTAHNKAYITGGAATLAGSLITASLLATFAYWSNPEVINDDEATRLVSAYNSNLLKRIRGEQGSLKWLPVITTDGASLAVAGRF
jgi:hypothetical protein